MKIFAKEIMVRQHEVPRLPYEIDLCLIVHKLVTEVDEDGHVYYGEEKHQIRQKLIENLGFIFIRINPNVEKFDLNVEMANIYNYINESPVRQVVNLTENIKKKVCKRIIELNVKRFIAIKTYQVFHEKNTSHNIRHEEHTIKNKTDKNWKRTWNKVLFGHVKITFIISNHKK